MKERPILFSGPMVRAILDGRKTQTRRVVKPQIVKPSGWGSVLGQGFGFIDDGRYAENGDHLIFRCPYGSPGDRLWVRETWYIDDSRFKKIAKKRPKWLEPLDLYFRADGECCKQIPECQCADVGPTPWRSSIHMPRWASRVTLEVVGLRVERIQDISEEDARAEGVADTPRVEGVAACRRLFGELWDSTNAKRGFSWKKNPWVWVVEFRRLAP